MIRCPKCGKELPDEAQFCPEDGEPIPVLVGAVLDGRYRVDGHLATGGVGTVYRGTHLALRAPVAIKVLRGAFATLPELVERFEREARALSAIRHVNVVAISDFGVAEGVPFIVMEHLEGRALSEEIRSLGRLPVTRAVAILRQVLAALGFAHARGVVHRDLKPSNVMLVAQPGLGELVKILDFGLAKYAAEPETGARGEPLTRTGMVFGTPAYMAPEQAMGHDVDERSDIYACGVMLYEMLVGRRPFHGSSGSDLSRRRLLEQPTPPSEAAPEADIPAALDAVVLRALRKTPAERFGSAGELTDALAVACPGAEASTSTPISGWERADPRPGVPLGVEATIPAIEALAPEALPNDGTRASDDAPTSMDLPGSTPSGRRRGPPSPDGALAAPTGPPRPRRRSRTLFAAGAAAVLLAGAITTVAFWPRGSRGDDPAPATDGGSAAREAPDTAAPLEEPRPTSGARDPFAEPLPEDLAWFDQSLRGGEPSRSDRRRRGEVRRRYGEDPRLPLLLGHSMAERGWTSDALGRYERALELDPTVRGDPRLRERLLDALGARRQVIADRTLASIERFYGDEAEDLLLWGAYEHPRQEAADAAVSVLDRQGRRQRLDPVLLGLGDVARATTCASRRDALDRLRGRRDARIAPRLEQLASGSEEVASCLGDLLEAVVRDSRPTAP